MKIWQKSLVALGIVGTGVGAIALGTTLGYNNYQYKKHFGRGNFTTALPIDMSNAKIYFASPNNKYEKLTSIDQNDKTPSGQTTEEYSRAYLSANGQQPLEIIDFAGTKFINEIPLYIRTETFISFIDWFFNKAEYGPEISSLDQIVFSGKTTEDGSLGAFSTDFETQGITYYIGQFFGNVRFASTFDYPTMDLDSMMTEINNAVPGLLIKLNKRPIKKSDIERFLVEFNDANKKVEKKVKLYSMEKINNIDGEDYFNIFMDNSNGIIQKIENAMPRLLKNNSPVQFEEDSNGNFSVSSSAKKIPSYTKLSTLDIMDIYGMIPNGIALDFLKYTMLHEYGHHQSNTSGATQSSESPVLANGVDANTLKHSTSWTSLESINSYFSARAPRLKAVRMDSLMHAAPADADPSSYPFIAMQYMVDPTTPGGQPTWHTLTPQEIFQVNADLLTLDEPKSLIFKKSMSKIETWANSINLPLAQALLLLNMDPFVNTKIPKIYQAETPLIYVDRNNDMHIIKNLTDADSPFNAYKWATQFKTDLGDYIFKAPENSEALVTSKGKIIKNYQDKAFLKVVNGVVTAQDDYLYTGKEEIMKGATTDVPVPTISDESYNSKLELLKGMITKVSSGNTFKYYLDEGKMTSGDIFVKATKAYLTSKELNVSAPEGTTIVVNGVTYTYVLPTTTSVNINGTNTPLHNPPMIEGFFDLSKHTASNYDLRRVLPDGQAFYNGPGSYTMTAPTGHATQLEFTSEADALSFLKDKLGLFIYSYLLNKGAAIKKSRSEDSYVKSHTTLEFAMNNMKNNRPESQVAPFAYEMSFNEILTRDYVQLLFDETMVEPIGSNGLSAGIQGLYSQNPLAQGTPLDPSVIISSFTDKFKADTASKIDSMKQVFEKMRDHLDSDLVSNTIFDEKGSGFFVSGVLNNMYFGMFKETSPISATNKIPGLIEDLSLRMGLNWGLYDENRNPITDSSIRIKDLDGTLVTDRVRAYWMFVLNQKGIFGAGGKDRTVSGIWHSKDKDAFYMWGYIPKDTTAKNITFTSSNGTKKSFKLNLMPSNRMGYNEKQFDPSSRHTLADDGYVGWSIDYKTMGTYKDADLTSGEYTVSFTDENGNEVLKADGTPLFSMGERHYVTNNNQYHKIASVVFESTNTDQVILRVRDYF